MTFNQTDIYTTSGSQMLYNSWTPYVSKFDTSSFYNWEQDNLPLYDLEERTYELWEKAGFPTSSTTGFSLTVSADTPAATLLANNNIFVDVSSCIAALPDVIRCPIVIEVCQQGPIGPMHLHNIRMSEAGSLEIINRAYTKVFNTSGTVGAVTTSPAYNKYATLANSLISQDVSATLASGTTQVAVGGPSGIGVSTSGVNIQSRVVQTTDVTNASLSRLSSVNSFLYPQFPTRKAPLAVSMKNAYSTVFPGYATAYQFGFPPYENVNNTGEDNTLDGVDISGTNTFTDGSLKRAVTAATNPVGGSIYLNALHSLSVKNSDGPIYIRNFFVNGETRGDTKTGTINGIDINNSDVVLENCAASRCRKAGFKFTNSQVVLSRSAYSYRNYDLTSTTGRAAQTGIGFHAVNSDVSISAVNLNSGADGGPRPGATVGDWQASGDDVMVIASRNYAGWKLDNSQLHGGFERLTATDENTGGITSSEVNTGYGMILNNSHVDLVGLLDMYGNSKGIQAANSTLKFNNLCVESHEEQGIRSKNSTFTFDSTVTPGAAGQAGRKQVDFFRNGQHMELQSQSEFGFARHSHIPEIYGQSSFKGSFGSVDYDGAAQGNLPAISVSNNSNLELVSPNIHARYKEEMTPNVPNYGLGIRTTENSKTSLYGTGTGATFVWGPATLAYQGKSAGLYADHNSTVNLHGPTVIAQFGVDVLAENNSVINIEPPRVRDSYSLEVSAFDLSAQKNATCVELHSTRACLVVNKNSTLNMTDLGSYPSLWSGTTEGNAMLADGQDYVLSGAPGFNSSAVLVGGSLQFFPNPNDPNAYTDTKLDNLSGTVTTLGAYTVPDFPVFTNKSMMNVCLTADDPVSGTVNYTGSRGRERFTYGGMCVRAAQDSSVNVLNVHFPTGTDAGPMDELFYDASGSTCSRLMIWNIADTSRLNAAFTSVSGSYPATADYHGPSAMYVSAHTLATTGNDFTQGTCTANVYGAPLGTPDTGNLSVLDIYGAGSSIGWHMPSGVSFNSPLSQALGSPSSFDTAISQSTHKTTTPAAFSALAAGLGVDLMGQIKVNGGHIGAAVNSSNNRGVFRIYWSPSPAAKLITVDASGYQFGAFPRGSYAVAEANLRGAFSGIEGPAYQIFAQGYNLSANAGTVSSIQGGAVNASSLYPELVTLAGNPVAAGTLGQITGSLPGGQGFNNAYHALATSGWYYCKQFLDDNPTQCMLDESASNTFANAKNASLGWSGRPKRVTLYRSRSNNSENVGSEAFSGRVTNATQGGLGALHNRPTTGIGFKSADIFDLKRDN
jgi:hypothetical protein